MYFARVPLSLIRGFYLVLLLEAALGYIFLLGPW
jgi:hypothetical protein